MTEEREDFTEEEAKEMLRSFADSKASVHSFFTNIIKANSTTKTGNLDSEELGLSKLPLRSILELELFCQDIYQQPEWANYFKKLGEIQTASSLSKDAKLIELAVTSKKHLADVTPRRKKNKGMFGFGKRKDDGGSETG